jgi:tetratricopeptide (TPR) repeat protein
MDSAASYLAQSLSDMGQLNAAYDRAIALVRRRPDSARAHNSLAYVLRYSGAVEEATRECDAAKQRDPFNYEWRSCANAFMLANDYKSAREFIALDAGSHWAGVVTSTLLLREGKREDAAAMIPDEAPTAGLIKATMRGEPKAKLEVLTQELEARVNKITDPEIHYWTGEVLAAMGQRAAALRMVRYAMEKNYCAYPAIESDPTLSNLASEAEFPAIKQEAKKCRERFEEHRKTVATAK